MSRRVSVFGFGSRFDRRFGKALQAMHFSVELAETRHPLNGDAIIVVSYLDGEPGLLPDLSSVELADRTVVISDQPLPASAEAPRAVIGESSAAEELLFHLCSYLPEAERRSEPRHLASTGISYRVATGGGLGTRSFAAELTNLSLGGAFIRTLNPPAVGTRVQLEIEISADDPPLTVNARVVYQVIADLQRGIVHNPARPECPLATYPGFAVAFNGSSFETRSALQRLLRQLQESESESESEPEGQA